MNPGNHDPDGFDRSMRQLHATALEQVSPTVRARLRGSRHAAATTGESASKRGAWPWLAASLASAVLAVAIGVQWLPGELPGPAGDAILRASDPSATQEANTDGLASLDQAAFDQAALDESPEFYLWLASAEAVSFAME